MKTQWNEQRARSLIGKSVLIGVTRGAAQGRDVRQMFGVIQAIDEAGVDIELDGADAGETLRVPPDLAAFQPAGPGEHLLRATGEIITDPDLVGAFTFDPPRDARR